MKQIYTHTFLDIAGSKIVDIESKDLVANYMWRFRRSDSSFQPGAGIFPSCAIEPVIPGIPSEIGRPISVADHPMKALKNIEFKNCSL